MNIKRLKPITIDLYTFTPEMVDWYYEIGGRINTRVEPTPHRRSETRHYAAYGNSKWSYFGQEGNVRLHFCQEDASVALIFLMKFIDFIAKHNMEEYLDEKSFSY